MHRSLVAAILTLALGAGATPAFAEDGVTATPSRDCFNANNVSSFRYVDERTVDVRAGVNRWFRLSLFSNARELDFDFQIALITRGSNFICTGDRFAGDIVGVDPFRSSIGHRWRYQITGVALAPDHPKYVKPAGEATDAPQV
jgi:hypothetical protein